MNLLYSVRNDSEIADKAAVKSPNTFYVGGKITDASVESPR